MRQPSAAVGKAVPEGLINGNDTSWRVEANGPRRGQRGLRRKIETERNAEFALLAIGVLLQFCSAEIRGQVNVGRLERLASHGAERGRHLMVEEARDWLVVGDVTARTLKVAELNRSGADQMAVITTQGRNVKRMDEIGERRIAALPKHRG